MIGGAGEIQLAILGALDRVPGDIDVVAERTRQISITGDKWLVLKTAESAGVEVLLQDRAERESCTTIGRAIDNHRIALKVIIDARNEQLREEDRALCVYCHPGIGSKSPCRSFFIYQRLVGAYPTGSTVGRKIRALRVAKDFVGSGSEYLRVPCVDGYERLALRARLVADVDVGEDCDA